MSNRNFLNHGEILYTVGEQEDTTVKSVKWKDGPRYCKICGKELTGRKQHYCSTECKAEGKKRYSAEYVAKLKDQKERAKEDKGLTNSRRPPKQTACIYCGKPIPPRRVIFCSDKCAHLYNDVSPTTEAEEKKKEKAAKKKKKAMTWDQILKGMEKTGMQYGEYVAFVEEKRR